MMMLEIDACDDENGGVGALRPVNNYLIVTGVQTNFV
jgi:hypothetical protein